VHEYDLIADWYASDRSHAERPAGVPEVTNLALTLPRGARVLDIGCGTGIPLTRVLLDAGHQVLGLDSSARMLNLFRINLPGVPLVRGLVQDGGLADESFDAAIAWGIMFHLTQPEQIKAIAAVSRVLRPEAPFLFTSGDADGRSPLEGTMNGVVFRYYSFRKDEYERILNEHGFTLVSVHADHGHNTYYLARRRQRLLREPWAGSHLSRPLRKHP
jgi:SAM-dependent methyltransferase